VILPKACSYELLLLFQWNLDLFDVYWTMHHCDNWRIKKPTRCHLIFHCTSYRLNMFWALLCPSSGASEYYVVYHIGHFVLGLLYVGGEARLGWSGVRVAGLSTTPFCCMLEVWLGWSGFRVAGSSTTPFCCMLEVRCS